ncbi:uncharacterized protein OCT59_025099 [Rhizophagus irregularis]|uniref:uncharacterized protein n=1 Tax=Rhizophagus irregularis TaxID=588596 RepID=UPI00332ECBDF|nr:hypothetical protein OCT59_025099 [Rhizophagus irregularis]
METNVSYNFFVRLCVFDFENEMVFLAYLTWKRKEVKNLIDDLWYFYYDQCRINIWNKRCDEKNEPSAYSILEENEMTSECFGFWMIMGSRSTNHWEFVMGTV